jgi:hypothetical protein
MTYSYDLTTSIGKIRLIIPDRVEAEAMFTDEELTAMYSMEGSSVKRGAALALETIAADEALVSKAIKILDLQTNGPAVAASLLNRAKTLREQATLDDPDEIAGSFDFAEPAYSPFGVRRVINNRRLRNNG